VIDSSHPHAASACTLYSVSAFPWERGRRCRVTKGCAAPAWEGHFYRVVGAPLKPSVEIAVVVCSNRPFRKEGKGWRMRSVASLLFSLFLASSAAAMGNFSGTPSGGPGGAPPSTPEPAAIAVFGVGALVVGYALHRRRAR
jgi:hypothetical protein